MAEFSLLVRLVQVLQQKALVDQAQPTNLHQPAQAVSLGHFLASGKQMRVVHVVQVVQVVQVVVDIQALL